MTTRAQSDANTCPECGAGFDTAEALQDHFMDDHLVSKSEAAESAGSSRPGHTSIEADPTGANRTPEDSTSGASIPSPSPEASAGTGRVADRLIVLLAVLLVGLLGAGVGIVYLDVLF